MEITPEDWRYKLCSKLAELCDAAKVPLNSREWVLMQLSHLADMEKALPVEQRMGALRAMHKYSQNGLTMIVTIVKSMRRQKFAAQGENVKPAEVTDAIAAHTALNRVIGNREPFIAKAPIEHVYSLLLKEAYDGDTVVETIKPFLTQSLQIVYGAMAIIQGHKKAGLRLDLLMLQNITSFEILRLLEKIDWISAVISKPVALYGESVIAAD